MWSSCNSLRSRGSYHESLFDEQTFCLCGEAILLLLETALYFHVYYIHNWKYVYALQTVTSAIGTWLDRQNFAPIWT
jgi:hypothetical protein